MVRARSQRARHAPELSAQPGRPREDAAGERVIATIPPMVQVSNADRVVFPEVGRTKGDVVRYYERIAPRLLPHVLARPLSILRYPKGLAARGFFQKNVPDYYPPSIGRFAVP